jgi:hypothetical protein
LNSFTVVQKEMFLQAFLVLRALFVHHRCGPLNDIRSYHNHLYVLSVHILDELLHVGELFLVDFEIVDALGPLRIDVDNANGNVA